MLSRRKFIAGCMCCGAAATTPAFAQEVSAPALTVAPLADDVWLHTSWKLQANNQPFPSTGMIVKGLRRVLLIDTTWPLQDMPRLLDQVELLAPGLPVLLACTHAHNDRMSGIGIARARGVRSIAHALSQEDAPGRGLPTADETWRGTQARLELGGRHVELFYPGPAHTRDNVVAFIPEAGVLFGGCIFRTRRIGMGNTADADLGAYADSVRNVITRYGPRVRTVVPGHGKPGGPELLRYTLHLAMAATPR